MEKNEVTIFGTMDNDVNQDIALCISQKLIKDGVDIPVKIFARECEKVGEGFDINETNMEFAAFEGEDTVRCMISSKWTDVNAFVTKVNSLPNSKMRYHKVTDAYWIAWSLSSTHDKKTPWSICKGKLRPKYRSLAVERN